MCLFTPTRRVCGYMCLKTMHVCECCRCSSKQLCKAVIKTKKCGGKCGSECFLKHKRKPNVFICLLFQNSVTFVLRKFVARFHAKNRINWWPGAESNCRHADFQSAALPTELPGLGAEIVTATCKPKAAYKTHKAFNPPA